MRNVYLYGALAVFVLALAAAGCHKMVKEPATGVAEVSATPVIASGGGVPGNPVTATYWNP